MVGTIEFADEMSKYNLPYDKCSYNETDIKKNKNLELFNDTNKPLKIIFARQLDQATTPSQRYKFVLNQVLNNKQVKYENLYSVENPYSVSHGGGGKNNRTNKRKTKRSKLKKISGIKKFRKTYKLKVKKLKY